MGDDGAPRFGDDVRAGDPGLVADVLHLVDDVVGVLLDGVVDAGKIARLGAVVIDPQAAADIDVLQADPELLHLHVDAGPLDEGVLDLVDLGDLAADMEMEELEVVEHPFFLQDVDGGDDFRDAQAELGILAAGGGPFAGPLG